MDSFYVAMAALAGVAGIVAAVLAGRTRGLAPEHELARRLRNAALGVRNRIAEMRSPVEADPEDSEIQLRGHEIVCERRSTALAKALTDLRAEVDTAKVVWGAEVLEAADALELCGADVDAAVSLYLRELRRLPRDIDPDEFRRRSRVLHRLSVNPEPEESSRALAEGVAGVERLCAHRLSEARRA